MPRKIEDFKEFIAMLKSLGYRKQIPLSHLKFFIARDYGSSDYIINSFIKCLVDFGFLTDGGVAVFNIGDGWDPTIRDEKTIKEAEKKASKEVDDLLGRVKHAK